MFPEPSFEPQTPGLPGAQDTVGLPSDGGQPMSFETSDAIIGQRPRFGVRADVGGFGWQLDGRDFAPNGYQPAQTRTTQVGKYGGAPIAAATTAMPMSVLASRIQGAQLKRQQAQQAMASFDPMKGVEDVSAPEYRDSFQRAVMGDINGFVNSTLSNWGQEEGIRRLQSATSPEGQALRSRAANWTTTARSINQATKDATAIVAGMNDGTLEADPTLKRQAQDVLYKLGEYSGQQDPGELARTLPRFTANVAFYDQLKKDGVDQILKNSGSVQDVVTRVQSGELRQPGFATWLNTKVTNRDQAVDALTDYYARQYTELPRAEIRRRIDAITPTSMEQTITTRAIPRASGGSGSGSGQPGSNAAAYTVDSTVLPTGVVQGNGEAFPGVAEGAELYRPTLNLMDMVSKQGRTSAPMTFRDGGNEVFMHPQRIMNVAGNLYVVGSETGMPRTRAEAQKKGMSTLEFDTITKEPESEEAQAIVEKFNLLQSVMVPYDENEALLNQKLGLQADKVRTALVSAEGGNTTPAARAQRPIVPPGVDGGAIRTSQSAQAKPPVAGARQAPNGKWYVKKDDGWYEVQ